MDPTAALESILRGHMMLDHVEALRDWLRSGGFWPACVRRPANCAPCLTDLPFDTDITADSQGLLVIAPDPQTGEQYCRLVYSWRELLILAEENDACMP